MKSLLTFSNESKADFVNEAFKSPTISKLFNSSDSTTKKMMKDGLDWAVPLGSLVDGKTFVASDSLPDKNGKIKGSEIAVRNLNEAILVDGDRIVAKIKYERKHKRTETVYIPIVLYSTPETGTTIAKITKAAESGKYEIFFYPATDSKFSDDSRAGMQRKRDNARDVKEVRKVSDTDFKLYKGLLAANKLAATIRVETAKFLTGKVQKQLDAINKTLPNEYNLESYSTPDNYIGIKVKGFGVGKPWKRGDKAGPWSIIQTYSDGRETYLSFGDIAGAFRYLIAEDEIFFSDNMLIKLGLKEKAKSPRQIQAEVDAKNKAIEEKAKKDEELLASSAQAMTDVLDGTEILESFLQGKSKYDLDSEQIAQIKNIKAVLLRFGYILDKVLR